MKRFAIASMLAVATTLTGAIGAAAATPASNWRVQSTKSAGVLPNSTLRSVSCPATTLCIGVGGGDSNPGSGFAFRWNGAKWQPQTIVEPSGAYDSSWLNGVSCASATACIAVGGYVASSGTDFTLAERWNGHQWVMQSIPSPGSYGPNLTGIACPTPTDCIAVGAYQAVPAGPGVTLVEQWNGATWTVLPSPNIGSFGNSLSSVSCTSPSACTAAGVYIGTGDLEHMLVERWNGSVWSAQALTDPVGFTQAWLAGVSCASASSCTAVGAEASTTQTLTLAEHWSGGAWTIQPTSSGLAGELTAVSCTTSRACTAVGLYQIVAGRFITLKEVWNGRTWRIAAIASPRGQFFAALDGVSCVSASRCEAAGYSFTGDGSYVPFAEGNAT
jgi:hypothetical protein